MTSVVAAVVPLVVATGLLMSVSVLLTTRNLPAALGILLDMLLAAGLLRLSATSTWTAIASAALVVAIRKLVGAGIGTARRARQAPSAA